MSAPIRVAIKNLVNKFTWAATAKDEYFSSRHSITADVVKRIRPQITHVKPRACILYSTVWKTVNHLKRNTLTTFKLCTCWKLKIMLIGVWYDEEASCVLQFAGAGSYSEWEFKRSAHSAHIRTHKRSHGTVRNIWYTSQLLTPC